MEYPPEYVQVVVQEKPRSGCLAKLVLLLVLGVVVYLLVGTVRSTIQASFQPISEMAGSMATQVADVIHPTPTIVPDPVSIIHEVRSLARLETIQYTIEKVLTAETSQGPLGFLFGDRLILVAHGVVVAGVDLGKLQPADLKAVQGVLYVHLPVAEVFIATLDNQKSHIYSRDTGLLSHGNADLETAARQAAETEIQKTAIEDGILEKATQNAESLLFRMFHNMGYSDVVYVDEIPAP